MNIKYEDGIEIHHPDISEEHQDFDAKHLDNLYQAENCLFWSIVRKEFLLSKFSNYLKRDANIIEIGAGTGDVSRTLLSAGYSNIAVGEMHLNGLRYAKTYGIERCYQFDLLRTPFENKFEAVCMFDVLEHIEDDELALKSSFKMLERNGYIVITVPAHMWLWNRSDRVVGHKKRYTKTQLISLLSESGFEVLEARYFFILITPLLFLRRLIDFDNASPVQDDEKCKHLHLPSIINKALLLLSRFENKVSQYLPNKFGGSLFIIGRKK
jgi:2-polyprenyl-3-methyl-5-hydroxy-6-metoxy-1,4-benzoquinol methylase